MTACKQNTCILLVNKRTWEEKKRGNIIIVVFIYLCCSNKSMKNENNQFSNFFWINEVTLSISFIVFLQQICSIYEQKFIIFFVIKDIRIIFRIVTCNQFVEMLNLLNGLYYNKNSPFYTLKKHIAPTKVDKTSPFHKYYIIHTEGVLTITIRWGAGVLGDQMKMNEL